MDIKRSWNVPLTIWFDSGSTGNLKIIPILAGLMIALTSLFHVNSNKTNNIQSDNQQGVRIPFPNMIWHVSTSICAASCSEGSISWQFWILMTQQRGSRGRRFIKISFKSLLQGMQPIWHLCLELRITLQLCLHVWYLVPSKKSSIWQIIATGRVEASKVCKV